jgi:hypothetical protein
MYSNVPTSQVILSSYQILLLYSVQNPCRTHQLQTYRHLPSQLIGIAERRISKYRGMRLHSYTAESASAYTLP